MVWLVAGGKEVKVPTLPHEARQYPAVNEAAPRETPTRWPGCSSSRIHADRGPFLNTPEEQRAHLDKHVSFLALKPDKKKSTTAGKSVKSFTRPALGVGVEPASTCIFRERVFVLHKHAA